MILGTTVCWEGYRTEHQQALPHSVCAERSFRPGLTGQDIHRFYQRAWIIKVTIKLCL